jgi:hypothetical protein
MFNSAVSLAGACDGAAVTTEAGFGIVAFSESAAVIEKFLCARVSHRARATVQ